MKLSDVAKALDVELRLTGADVDITAVSSPGAAKGGSLTFAEDAHSLAAAVGSRSAAVIVSAELAAAAPLKSLAFAQAARLLRHPEAESGIHPTAAVHTSVTTGENVSVGPYAVIEAHAQIGPWTRIGAGAVIGAGVKTGAWCRIYPRVVIYPGTELGNNVVLHAGVVLGSDGFGYVRDAATGEYLQFPQQGRLILEDDVEIGANTTIDRGALEETRIERGVKIDNLVHLGHNVRVGRNVVIAAQTGVSGSSSIGAGAVVGGQVGIGDHATVGEQVILGSGSGVLTHKKVRGPGIVFWGRPAKPLRQYLKELAALAKLGRASDEEGE